MDNYIESNVQNSKVYYRHLLLIKMLEMELSPSEQEAITYPLRNGKTWQEHEEIAKQILLKLRMRDKTEKS